MQEAGDTIRTWGAAGKPKGWCQWEAGTLGPIRGVSEAPLKSLPSCLPPAPSPSLPSVSVMGPPASSKGCPGGPCHLLQLTMIVPAPVLNVA